MSSLRPRYDPIIRLLTADRGEQIAEYIRIARAVRETLDAELRGDGGSPSSADLIDMYGDIMRLLIADRDVQFQVVGELELEIRHERDQALFGHADGLDLPALPGHVTGDAMAQLIGRSAGGRAGWQGDDETAFTPAPASPHPISTYPKHLQGVA